MSTLQRRSAVPSLGECINFHFVLFEIQKPIFPEWPAIYASSYCDYEYEYIYGKWECTYMCMSVCLKYAVLSVMRCYAMFYAMCAVLLPVVGA